MDNRRWLKEKGWGLFIHYLESLQNNPETPNNQGAGRTSWEECVNQLDVERLAQDVASTGAGYLVFTLQQQTRFACAPNPVYDRFSGYRPGEACCTRDLIGELYEALHRRGVALFLYFTGDGPFRDEQAFQGLGGEFGRQAVNREMVANWCRVLEYYSRAYGDKIKGWWMDGTYPAVGYELNGPYMRSVAEAARAGNPEALISENYWGCLVEVYEERDGVIYGNFRSKVPDPVEVDDYSAGELVQLGDLPDNRDFGGPGVADSLLFGKASGSADGIRGMGKAGQQVYRPLAAGLRPGRKAEGRRDHPGRMPLPGRAYRSGAARGAAGFERRIGVFS